MRRPRSSLQRLVVAMASVILLSSSHNQALQIETFTGSPANLASLVMQSVPSTLHDWWGSDDSAEAGVIKGFRLASAHHQSYDGRRAMYAPWQRPSIERLSLQTGGEMRSLNAQPFALRSVQKPVTRLRDPKKYLEARRKDFVGALSAFQADEDSFETVSISQPNVSDRLTLRTLAQMSNLAYYAPNDTGVPDGGWNADGGWNLSSSFGWVEDGIRGHVFASEDNKTVVLALKGTSAAVLPGGGGETARRDKMNDNLLFSCCCAHVGWTWHTVCDCFGDSAPPDDPDGNLTSIGSELYRAASVPTCSKNCLSRALVEKSLYYPATTDLYNNVSYLYPDSQIWVTGHSLGGALGALIGYTFGVPVVSFEAPAERMAAQRLHLPFPKGHTPADAAHVTSVYHTADPIPMGECIGSISACATAGFAMESKCHGGQVVLYDTERLLDWSSNVLTHRIATLVDDVFGMDWGDKVREYQEGKKGSKIDEDELKRLQQTPLITNERKCVECQAWKYVDKDLPSKAEYGLSINS
ncbi:alpha/beta-hydrolase [Ceraceosorus guamensis]|uniref:triacylglycerol lipase n=1 Tax=Ceraceosorus guamensis TaxID=1522189 RepID=A0A316VXB7_9BASI|nr:alpha/beta-hydrolase [Ceraceosorus guamensis]PWN40931.1 alpha/beta-hydrolase [Ceraceosorus guamensis]